MCQTPPLFFMLMTSSTFLECPKLFLGIPQKEPHMSLHSCGPQKMAALLFSSFLAPSGPSPLPTKSLEKLLITGTDHCIQTQRVQKLISHSWTVQTGSEPRSSLTSSGGAWWGGLWPLYSVPLFSSPSTALHPPVVTKQTCPCTWMKTSRYKLGCWRQVSPLAMAYRQLLGYLV